MRLFNAKIIDRRLEGDNPYAFADGAWGCLLARAEALKFVCVIDQVSNSPTVVVELGGGAELKFFELADYEGIKTLISVGPLSGPVTTAASYSAADVTWPPPKHLAVVVALGGTNAAAHVELWVCGRGPEALEAAPAQATFAAQLAAARRCEDENRLAGRKRVLKAGASLYYPPEVFDPSLRWDR